MISNTIEGVIDLIDLLFPPCVLSMQDGVLHPVRIAYNDKDGSTGYRSDYNQHSVEGQVGYERQDKFVHVSLLSYCLGHGEVGRGGYQHTPPLGYKDPGGSRTPSPFDSINLDPRAESRRIGP
jgi:hypothetical protein